jgi:hypothetical protein
LLDHRWAIYTSQTYTLAVGADLRQEGFRIDAQPTDFYLMGVSMRQQLGQFRLRIRRPDGSLIQTQFANSNNIEEGSVKPRPLPIWPPVRYPFNSMLQFDLANPATAAPNNVTGLVFWGVHSRPGAPPPAPSNPVTQLPWDLTTEVTVQPSSITTIPLVLPFNSNPLEVRMLLYSNDYSVDDPPEDLYCHIRDDMGASYMNDWTNVNQVFNHEDQAWPGLPNPSIVVPPYGSLKLDLKETAGDGPFHLQFKFGGVLLDAR